MPRLSGSLISGCLLAAVAVSVAGSLAIAEVVPARPAVMRSGTPLTPVALQEAQQDQVIRLSACRVKVIDQVVLASGQNGIIGFVEVREGSEVQAGQSVVGLRDEVPAAALATAELQATNDVEIRYARKATDVAIVEHQQAVRANEQARSAVSELEVMRLKLAADRSELQIEQAQIELDLNLKRRDEARALLDTFRIEAPFDGVVTKLFKYRGEAVRQGDPVLELTSVERLRVEAEVDVRQVHRIAQGDLVDVWPEIPGTNQPADVPALEGKVTFVDVTADPVRRVMRVLIEVDNSSHRLTAGLTASVTIFPSRNDVASRIGDR